MRIAAFIPARWSSTRFEGKPLALIAGKPMIQWVYERARESSLLDDVAVATDDSRIFDEVLRFGGKAVMTKASHGSGTERVAEAAGPVDADIVVNIQGDEPLIEAGAMDLAIKPLLEHPGIYCSTLKTRITEEDEYLDPNVVKVVTDRSGFAIYFSRSPIPYSRKPFSEMSPPPFKHIGLYVFRRDFLFEYAGLPETPLERSESLEQMRALEYGFRIRVLETKYNPVSVDTPEDLARVRAIIEGSPL